MRSAAARACARLDCSLNVLDYPTTLNISLKQTNDVSVLATFNYEVKSYMRMTKGDRQTLAREAEAISSAYYRASCDLSLSRMWNTDYR